MRMSERKKMADAFNSWRAELEQNYGVYPSYCIENMTIWLETTGQKYLKKLKPRKATKGVTIILAYRMHSRSIDEIKGIWGERNNER